MNIIYLLTVVNLKTKFVKLPCEPRVEKSLLWLSLLISWTFLYIFVLVASLYNIIVDVVATIACMDVEDCFTPWLIHDEGEFIFIIFKEFFFFFLLLFFFFLFSFLINSLKIININSPSSCMDVCISSTPSLQPINVLILSHHSQFCTNSVSSQPILY